VARRKAKVLAALMGGLLTVETICRKYDLSEEELLLGCGLTHVEDSAV
jgi:hypothetical protein